MMHTRTFSVSNQKYIGKKKVFFFKEIVVHAKFINTT